MSYRKSAVELTTQEKDKFIAAVKTLKTTLVPTRDGNSDISRYDQFVAIHLGVTTLFDGAISQDTRLADGGRRNAAFCAWHREYIRRFELALQESDPDVTLPYWDWTRPSETEHVLFQDDYMGPNGGPGGLGGGPVDSGHFAEANGWSVDDRMHVRGITTLDPPTDTFGSALLREIQPFERLASEGSVHFALRQPTFHEFRPALEAGSRLHNFGHGWIGGSMAMMSSPQDPIFYLHHANVDRIWGLWQDDGHEDANFYPFEGRPFGHNLTDPMWPWDGGDSDTIMVPWVENLLPEFADDDIVRPLDVVDHRGDRMGYSYI